MIRNIDINGIIVAFDDSEYNEPFLENGMLIYKLETPDGYFYIGKTKRTLQQRLIEHFEGSLNVDEKIREFEWVNCEILKICNTFDELDEEEKKYINLASSSKNILNEVLYKKS